MSSLTSFVLPAILRLDEDLPDVDAPDYDKEAPGLNLVQTLSSWVFSNAIWIALGVAVLGVAMLLIGRMWINNKVMMNGGIWCIGVAIVGGILLGGLPGLLNLSWGISL